MACPCASLHCCLTPLAAHNTPGTPGHEGPPPSPGIRRFVVNAPEGKNTNWMQSFGSQWVTGEPKKPSDGNDVASTFGSSSITSSTPVTSVPLLTLPPSRGTPNMQRSVTSRGGLGRLGMMRSGPRSKSGVDARKMDRPVQHHTFMADVADVRQIEQGLLQLMEDFQAGSLRAFGKPVLPVLMLFSVISSLLQPEKIIHYMGIHWLSFCYFISVREKWIHEIK